MPVLKILIAFPAMRRQRDRCEEAGGGWVLHHRSRRVRTQEAAAGHQRHQRSKGRQNRSE